MLEAFHLTSTAKRDPLRIGLMLDSWTLPAWAASIVDQIQNSNFARIEMVILNAAEQPAPANPAPLPVRAWRILTDKKRRGQFLYGLYFKWDSQRASIPNDPQRPVDCSARLSACASISVVPITKGFTHRFKESDLDIVRRGELDVILRFGFNILRGEILKVPRYGIWSYHHGDNEYYRGGPAYYWEIYERHPLSGVILQVLNEELDAGLVLCKANLETQPGGSVRWNRIQPYWTGSFFVIRKLHQLHQYGWENVVAQSSRAQLAEGRKKIYRTPTNGQMARFLMDWLLKRALPTRLRRERKSYWRVGLRESGNQLSLDSPDTRGFRWIESPKAHYYADPFLFERDGKTWLFFEDYSFVDKQGSIGCADVQPGGKISAGRTVLKPGHHLSYPFVVEERGEIYMLPEAGADHVVELYRADPFPDRWRLEKILFQGVIAVDTTLWVEDGIYWFFVTIIDPPEAGPQLFLFFAESLTGEWVYHPSNPICSDIRFARGAGRIFRENGRRIRPSQDHSRGYGCASRFNEIVELTTTSYRELPLGSIQPWEKGMTGTHTYNRSSAFEVLDANFPKPLHKLQ